MSLFKSASVVSAFTLLSRITGYAREVLFAIFFGANALTDAFNVAFRMPNLLRRLFAEGAFSQAFVPTLAATRAESGDARTRELLAHVATVLFWVLFLVSAAGVLAAPWLVWALASGLPADGEQAAVAMTRWMMPYIGLISFVSLASGVLNTWGKFAVSAFTPTLLNICLIATMWLGVPQMQALGYPGIYAQALGVMLGGIAQLLLQLWALKKINMLPRIGLTWQAIKTSWQHEDTQRILRLMLPAVLVRLLLPVAMLASVFFFLRGHNAPGGGFVGGLMLAAAVIMQYIVGGTLWVEWYLRVRPLACIALGLLCAVAAGLMAWSVDTTFLTSRSWHGSFPVLGEIHLSSVLLFDLGVYLLVFGATVLMLVAIAHQSLRGAARRPNGVP